MIGHKAFGLKFFTTELLTTTLIGATLLGPAAAQGLPGGGVPTPEGSAPHAAGSDNLLTLLPLLLTSPDRRQLAAELEVSIRNGDLKRAENSLNAAIEVGTLAIVLVDHLNNPDLVGALQSLGIRGDARPAPEPISADKPAPAESCPAPPAATPVNLADMQQALDQERSFSATVSQSLTGLMQERSALEAHLKKEQESQALAASEMQQTLQREQDQNQAAIRELEARQEEVRALRAAMEQEYAGSGSRGTRSSASSPAPRRHCANCKRPRTR
jgi:hypothetical protein